MILWERRDRDYNRRMILNIAAYLFVEIADVDALALTLRERAEAAALRGTILVTPEGLNLFLASVEDPLRDFLQWLRNDSRFEALHIKESWSERVPFARLKVKRKKEIITFRRDQSSPLELGKRAPVVAPRTLARWLQQGHDDAGKRVVMLDTRNQQEVAYGTFQGALTLPIDKFTDLPAALEPHRESLKDATIVSFCTGGVRCEKAALWLQRDGWSNMLQLDDGILGYFEQVGGLGYDGGCFVFDERVSLDPQLLPLVDGSATQQDAHA